MFPCLPVEKTNVGGVSRPELRLAVTGLKSDYNSNTNTANSIDLIRNYYRKGLITSKPFVERAAGSKLSFYSILTVGARLSNICPRRIFIYK